jgi:conjugative relaxase-like TrwC/TraI family protein
MLTIRAMTGGTGYAQRHLEHSDYYDQHRTVQGEWLGRGAELLGLNGKVSHEQFEAIREGLHPETAEFLRPRHSADRLSPTGEVESKARSLYDLTFSAPKSVSVEALVGGDERLLNAHRHAVTETLQEAERLAGARIRLDGANQDRPTGNLVVATYTHDSSRQLDPQLHTHAVVANLTYDGAEGRWKALQASGLYEHRAYLTEVYRNALAREVQALGYETESKRNSKGVDNGFEIRGISPGLLQRYSQRSAQRDESVRQFAAEHGRPPTDNEVAVLVRDSRPDKLHEISTADVHRLQIERISSQDHEELLNLRKQSQEHPKAIGPQQTPVEVALQHAKEHIFERKTVAKDHELLSEALRFGRGALNLAELRGTYEFEVAQGKLLQLGGNVTTHANLERERQMVAIVDIGTNRYPALGASCHFEPRPSLRPEQSYAVNEILESRDFVINLRGAAGTGKTATLQDLSRGLREAGHDVLAVAPTGSAVEELQKVGFKDSITIARLLEDQIAQQGLRGNVLIVDEAGMVSGRQMESILALAHREDARVVFSGDSRQIQSVEASDALRILERESRMISVSLNGIQRQSSPEYREAIETFRRSPGEGFDKLQDLGAIREVPYLERPHAVASAYREMTAESNQTVLVVAPTHEEIERLTHAIREDLKQRSVLGHGTTFQQHTSLQWTEAQKKDLANYQPGQILVFHRSSHGIEKHEALTVLGKFDSSLTVRNERGESKEVRLTQARSFSVHERNAIEVSSGDKLLFMANRRERGFRATNGELVTVRSVTTNEIQLEDGRRIPANYREFTHGYAVTAHRSQGKTVDRVIISGDAMKQELFCVSASRGREGISIITSDMDRLRESLGISMARPSAIELAESLSQKANTGEKAIENMHVHPIDRETLKHDISQGFGFGLGL